MAEAGRCRLVAMEGKHVSEYVANLRSVYFS